MASITWDEQGASDRPRREPLDYVDTLIGTAELGNTFPAVCLPFGLAKWTPQTVAGEHKGQPPYSYEHRRIQGIRWTNFIKVHPGGGAGQRTWEHPWFPHETIQKGGRLVLTLEPHYGEAASRRTCRPSSRRRA